MFIDQHQKEGYTDLTQSSKLQLRAVSNEDNVARVGGVSLLPNTIPWPQNPEGENLTLLFHLPASFINHVLHTQYEENTAISVFTTYNPDTYFLDNIVYHGDPLDLAHIQKGYTKVILHPISEPRNEFNHIFYLSDAVGYLFLHHDIHSDSVDDAGLFFVQCT